MTEEPDLEFINQRIDDYNELNERKGLCNRCGKCCYHYEPTLKERVACPNLDFDGEGLAVCNVYGTEKYPPLCEIYPVFPDPDPYWSECGYYWETKT